MTNHTCHDCKKPIKIGDESGGMNIPDVTDGPIYWCRSCKPPAQASEIINQIDSLINPPKDGTWPS